MTGSALFDFLIELILLVGVGALFFYAITGISPDALFTKIARLAVGLALLVVGLLAVKAVLFGGGGALAISPLGVIYFAIGIIVVLVVLYVIKLILGSLLGMFDLGAFETPIMYVIGALALIALLVLAANVLGGGQLGSVRPFRLSEFTGPYTIRPLALDYSA